MKSAVEAKQTRVCMVSHSSYESDNRVIRYSEVLAARGDDVHVIALRRSAEQPREEQLNGVLVHRVQDRFGKPEGSSWSHLWPLLRFAFVAARWLEREGRQRRFDLIHVHNIPDFLVFAACVAKLRGARVILDIHDIVPEFFASKFGASVESPLFRMLKLMERASAAVANHVILANHLWLRIYTTRSADPRKCSVVINHVDDAIFRPQEPPVPTGEAAPLIIFPGGLYWHQGLDIAIRAFARLRERMPTARFHLYGDGSVKPALISLTEKLGIADSVRFFDPLPLRQIAQIMATADLAVVPKRADSFGNEAYSTKIMEFMSVGVPVVVSNTRIDRYYFDDSVVRFFESGNDEALAAAMFELLSDPIARDLQVRNALDYVERHSWKRHQAEYLRLVDGLIGRVDLTAEPVVTSGQRS